MLRFRGKAAGIVAIAITLSSAPASALIVFDPTNYSQNLLQAARALEQIQHQVTSLQNEAQMLINQAKNLTSLPTSLLEQIEGNFSQMKILLGEADKLAYSVQDIDSQFASTYQNFGSDLS
ncbi:MAG: P-type conjugative transfer protein TrbJ, partial [Mesorhizobium sp.]